MSWFKVDDKLWGHPKWLATPIWARGLWVTAGSWSADQETDGEIPRHVLPILGATLRDASGLVAAGLWVASDTGWRFHGWAEFQPTRAQKDTERAKAKERMRLLRAKKSDQRGGSVRPNNDEQEAKFGRSSESVRSTPTRPDPTRPEKQQHARTEQFTNLTDEERAEFRRWLADKRNSSNPNGLIQHLAQKGELDDTIADWKLSQPKKLHPKLDPKSPEYDPSLAGAISRS